MYGLRATDSLFKELYIKIKARMKHRTFAYIVKKVNCFHFASSSSLRTRLSILPTFVFGNSSLNSIFLGHL